MMAAVVASSTAWRPSARPSAARCHRPRRSARVATRSGGNAATLPQQDLLAAVESLGYPASIFPGDEQSRAGIDSSIKRLEEANPTPSPLQQAERGGQPSPALLGDWQLIYASSGTYVTRTAAAQALLAASRLPGTGVADVRQALQLPPNSSGSGSGSSGQLRTNNAACFGLGPFGEWEVCIDGVWDIQDGSLARVSFESFTLQLVGMLGLKLPRMAKVTVPIKNSITADFTTTYVSEGVRIARGSKGNVFLFRKLA